MSQRLLSMVVLALAALVGGLALWWHPSPPGPASLTTSAGQGGDFTLQSAAGPVSLADFRGKAVLLYFGYTYCPDICPTSLAAASEGVKRLSPDEEKKVAMIFVSVDPERDTPAHLKTYAEFFHPRLVGLTGTPDEVAAVARLYGVFYARQKSETANAYVVDHSADTYLIGPDGRLVERLAHGTPPDQVAAAIRRVVR